ncbi:hypothetical protein HPP92_006425 [Vanilla planifolia]|uniref:Uncharacterized protein n=1 Tax=Vanilla planifolia TaxID=51239 RepID=A0A835V8N9_VANPL|nr:hypothetical protein HPP92_006425 [Vanilla planifolia]
METELPSLLRGVELVHAGRRQELKVLNQAAKRDAENRQGKNDAGAAAAADAEGDVAEIVPVGLHLGLLLEEPLRPELLRVLPLGRVVGEPPGVDEDLALRRDVVSPELGIVEVHVRHEKRDGHPKAEGLFHHSLKVREFVGVRLCNLNAGTKDTVELLAQLPLHLRVVHQLRNAPLDRPQGRLDCSTLMFSTM